MTRDYAADAKWHRREQEKWQVAADNPKYDTSLRAHFQKVADGHRSCAERAEKKIPQVQPKKA
jgi:hypothetical protein